MDTRAVIIDDEPLAAGIVAGYLESFTDIAVQRICRNGFEGYEAIRELQPDLIFLDIQMPRLTGLEMLSLLEKPPYTIFTTAHDEYAVQAFEQNAVDYLLKPFSAKRLLEAVRRFENRRHEGGRALPELAGSLPLRRIAVTCGSSIRVLPVESVMCIEAMDDYIKIHTGDDTYLKKQTMGKTEEILPPGLFLRVHRSYLVQLSQISRIEAVSKDDHCAILSNGMKVPLSRPGFQKVKELLLR